MTQGSTAGARLISRAPRKGEFTRAATALALALACTTQAAADAVIFEGDLVEVFFVGSTYRHCIAVGPEMVLVDAPLRCDGPRARVAVPGHEVKCFAGAPAPHPAERATIGI